MQSPSVARWDELRTATRRLMNRRAIALVVTTLTASAGWAVTTLLDASARVTRSPDPSFLEPSGPSESDVTAGAPLPGHHVPDLGDSVVWAHGARVPSFEPGNVYVLDFWATWCPPCYPMIDELSKLARDHRDEGLVIVGLTIGTELGTPLSRFLEQEAARIAYSLAVPRDDEALKAALSHPALNPPADFHLPHLMIVDRKGRLAWASEAGNPELGFEVALERVLSGSWDLQAEARRYRRIVAATAAATSQIDAVRRLREAGELDRATETLLPLVAENPAVFAEEAVDLFRQLLCAGKESSAYAFGRQLLRGGLQGRVMELMRFQRTITMTPGVSRRDFTLAADAVRAAQRLKEDDDPDFIYALAKITLLAGDAERAQTLQTEAVRLAERVGRDTRYIHTIRDLPISAVIESQARQMECSP